MSKDNPYWTQVIKYKKGTKLVKRKYPKVVHPSVKDAVDRINELNLYLYTEYPRAYDHHLYDWVINCDKYTQMILDQIKNL